MKRPMAVIGITYFLTLVAVGTLGVNVAIVLGVFALTGGLAAFFNRTLRQAAVVPMAFISVAVACFAYSAFWYLEVQPKAALADNTLTVEGQIVDSPEYKYERYYYLVETQAHHIAGAPQRVKIRVSSKDGIDADPYDHLKMRLVVYAPASSSGYDSKTYSYSQGIYLNAYVQGAVEVIPAETKPLYAAFLKLREDIAKAILRILPGENGKLAIALSVGDTSRLSEETTDSFRIAGISHLIAVSGANLSMLTMALMWFFRKLRMHKAIGNTLCILMVLAFMALSGFPASIMRAGIMMVVFLLGKMIGRHADGLNSLGLSVLLLTLFNPLAAMDVGLLLSFASTLGIILLTTRFTTFCEPAVTRIKPLFFHKLAKATAAVLSQTLAAVLFIIPISILVFKEISLIALLGNLAEIYAGSVVMLLASLAAAFTQISLLSFLAYPLFLAVGWICNYMLAAAKLLTQIPYAIVSARHSYLLLWLGCVLLLLALALLLRTNGKLLRLASLLSVVLLLVSVLTHQMLYQGVTTITALDVGNGTAVTLTKNGHAVVIGCGGDRNPGNQVYYALRDQGVRRMDVLLLPSVQTSDASGASKLARRMSAEWLVMPGNEDLKKQFHDAEIGEFYLSAQGEITLWEDVTLSYRMDVGCVYLTVEQTRILICSSPSFDVNRLPAEWKKPDLSILRASVPPGYASVHAGLTVLSDGETRGNAGMAMLQMMGKSALTTGGYGDLYFYTRGNGDITPHRGA